jgi:hypothetical protein
MSIADIVSFGGRVGVPWADTVEEQVYQLSDFMGVSSKEYSAASASVKQTP